MKFECTMYPIVSILEHLFILLMFNFEKGKTDVFSCSNCDYKVAFAKQFEEHKSKCVGKSSKNTTVPDLSKETDFEPNINSIALLSHIDKKLEFCTL